MGTSEHDLCRTRRLAGRSASPRPARRHRALICRPMSATAPPVRPVTLDEIRAARERIKDVIVRTPLVKLSDSPEIWLKLETLQPINAFKIRGAANAVAMLTPEARKR